MVAFYIPGMTNELLGARRTVPVEPVAAPSTAPVIALAPTTAPAATSSTARVVNIPGLGVIDIAAQQAAAQQAAAQQAEAQRIAEAQRVAAQQAAAQQVAAQQAAAQQAQAQRVAAQQAAAQQAEAQRVAAQQAAAQQAEARRVAAQQAEAQRVAAQQAAAQQAEARRVAAQQAEAQRVAAQQAAAQQAEARRVAAQQAAAQQAEAQRVAAQQAAAQRVAAQEAAAQQAEAQRVAAQQAEAQRVAARQAAAAPATVPAAPAAVPAAPAAVPAAPTGVSKDVWQTVLQNAGPQAVARLAAAEQTSAPAPAPAALAPVAPVAAPAAPAPVAPASGSLNIPGLGNLNIAALQQAAIQQAAIQQAAPAPAPPAANAAPEAAPLSAIAPQAAYVPGLSSYLEQNVAPAPVGTRVPDESAITPISAATVVPAAPAPAGSPLAAAPSNIDLSGIDLSRVGYEALGLPASYTPQPNYLVKPTRDLDPTSVALQTVDGTQGLQFVTNKGNAASIREKELGKKGATETSTGFVPLVEDAQYRFINEKGKDQVLYTGTGEEGLKNVYAMAQDLSATKGKKANWGVEMLDPATGQWRRVADDDPAKKWTSVVGDVLGAALPIATAFVPGLNVLGSVLTPALAGAAGAAISGKDPLKGALMGGLSAAGGQLLGPVIQSAGGVATNLGTALGTGLGTTAGGLATGKNLQNALLGGVAAGGLSYLGGELLGPKTPSADGTLVGKDVSGIAADTLAKEAAQGLGGSIGQQVGGSLGQQVAGGLGDFIVEAARKGLYNPAGVSSAIGSTAGNLLQQELSKTSPEAEDEQLVVTAKPSTPPSIVPGLSSIVSQLPSGAGQTPAAQPEKPLDENSTLDDIVNYLRLGGLGLGLVGDLFGGGGGSTGTNRVPAGLFGGSRSPVFGSTLPTPNMPGLASTAGPRTAADLDGQGLASPQDYYRYGYGPEQSFRSNIAAAPRNTSTAYTGYAEGGYAVGGPGDGRDDKIPAMLSDGEYVIDAETVAMLGNGSTKAGADALDKFRINIRKHKGRALSKGEFSDNAKKPEQYLKKGRR